MSKNQNCDGAHCPDINETYQPQEVRVYPIGGGGNLILCHACWAHENQYNFNRGKETRCPENFPQHDWATAKTYPEE